MMKICQDIAYKELVQILTETEVVETRKLDKNCRIYTNKTVQRLQKRRNKAGVICVGNVKRIEEMH